MPRAPLDDHSRWVFNRLATDYRRRPPYPAALVSRLLSLAGGTGGRVADLGAGTGNLAIPLARRGARVHAVEPARAMLDALAASEAGGGVVPIHAAAEESGLASAAFDLVILADSLQWVDAEQAGREAGRLLSAAGALAVVTPVLADTPFLRAVRDRIAAANPKARPAAPPVARLFSSAGLPTPALEVFPDETPLDPDALDAVLRSLSFVGPALGPRKLASLLADARALAAAHGGAAWVREIRLEWSRARTA